MHFYVRSADGFFDRLFPVHSRSCIFRKGLLQRLPLSATPMLPPAVSYSHTQLMPLSGGTLQLLLASATLIPPPTIFYKHTHVVSLPGGFPVTPPSIGPPTPTPAVSYRRTKSAHPPERALATSPHIVRPTPPSDHLLRAHSDCPSPGRGPCHASLYRQRPNCLRLSPTGEPKSYISREGSLPCFSPSAC